MGRFNQSSCERAVRRLLRNGAWAYDRISIRPFCQPGGQELQLLCAHAVQNRNEDSCDERKRQRPFSLFYYDIDYTVGDKHGKDDLYFHAHFRREDPTALQKDFEILPQVIGKGRYLGSSLGVQANRELYADKWWGEGEVKVYLDRDREWPTLVGTGTEDYVGDG